MKNNNLKLNLYCFFLFFWLKDSRYVICLISLSGVLSKLVKQLKNYGLNTLLNQIDFSNFDIYIG